ncbi:hypothetical protein NTGM5_150041 [Candidatus Nitrotoga sp. M5]|nr:hypothetical protein NTGM5_150041 [Candidatus Nitrotoga sp. M5]
MFLRILTEAAPAALSEATPMPEFETIEWVISTFAEAVLVSASEYMPMLLPATTVLFIATVVVEPAVEFCAMMPALVLPKNVDPEMSAVAPFRN